MRLNEIENGKLRVENWRKYKLEDIIQFNPKETIKKGETAKKIAMEKLEPFTREINGYEEVKYTSGTKFRNGDTLLARITPCLENGKTAQVSILEENEIGFGSTEFIVLREKLGITDKDFIYYLSISPEFRNIAIKSMNGSSGRQRVQNEVLEQSEIALPSLEEQKAIAHTLSTLDEKIETNSQINKKLEETAQTIFKQWFINFEFPNEDGEPYKSSGGEMVDSEMGMIPREWNRGTLNDALEFYDFKRVPLSSKQRENMKKVYPYYGAASLVDYVDDYIFDGIYVLVSEDGANVVDAKGYPLVQYVWNKFWVNNHAHIVKGKNGFNEQSVYIMLKNTNMQAIVTGAVQPKINQANLKSLRMLIPSQDVLRKFNRIVDSIFQQYRLIHGQNRILVQVRDVLLPKLMTGKIRVPLDN